MCRRSALPLFAQLSVACMMSSSCIQVANLMPGNPVSNPPFSYSEVMGHIHPSTLRTAAVLVAIEYVKLRWFLVAPQLAV